MLKGKCMMKKTYPAIFIPEESGFSVVFPEFSGGTQGKDLEDAMFQAKFCLKHGIF